MRQQINRLPAPTAKGFAGAHIDRSRTIHFTLNGRMIEGFAGDTVFSALLASGVDTSAPIWATPLASAPAPPRPSPMPAKLRPNTPSPWSAPQRAMAPTT